MYLFAITVSGANVGYIPPANTGIFFSFAIFAYARPISKVSVKTDKPTTSGLQEFNKFVKTIPKSLKREIVRQRVKDIYISLDRDARTDAIKLSEELMREGINVYFIDLPDKDPSELGFKVFTKLLHNAIKLTTSTLMKKRLALS